MSEPAKVPFDNWVPVPRRIFADRRAGELTSAEAWLILCLYEAANKRTWTASFADLDAIERRCKWEHSSDYLSKTLRSLRQKGRIDFETTPGKTSQSYRIRLLYDRSELSEHGPSRNACKQADSDRSRAQTGPSRRHVGPSSEAPTKPVRERDSGASDATPVRALQDVSREETTHGLDGGYARAVETRTSTEAELDLLWEKSAASTKRPPWA